MNRQTTTETSPAPRRPLPPPLPVHEHGIDPDTMWTAPYKRSPWNHYEQTGRCRCGARWSTSGGWTES
jgi:hypothetical protein